ncbi:DNA polymerase [Xylocopilactobacillus apis]|uniref:DNA-directed DNA polymerase n=1 Tax=Xylocopilactobacillus apis TaxID=2932183 RepID=A0AAU9CSD7_9LACO|nr:DNA polymerase [Xylocopilactobacillus apis]BDR56902.1 DNA polymerase [Xylocopilactobacillus apis]
MAKQRLMIDIETYSEQDLPRVGLYKYSDDPSFDVLIFAYQVNHEETVVCDLTQDEIPIEIVEGIIEPDFIKTAWNAQFERVCLTHYLRRHGMYKSLEYLKPEAWRDPMVHARELGLPGSLKQCADYLKVDQVKDPRGARLISYFSKPAKPTKANGMRTRNLPEHDPEGWKTFLSYCGQDVRTESSVDDTIEVLETPEHEWKIWFMDQRINDRGVAVDSKLANGAIDMVEQGNEENEKKFKDLTGVVNPHSLLQVKKWLADQGYPFEKLGKEIVQDRLAKGDLPDNVAEALRLKLSFSTSSTKKYLMMRDAKCSDDRLHGLLQFYGASRTGRWAGRLLQVQNLPRNYLSDLDTARELVREKRLDDIEILYDDVPDVLKQLIRTGLVASEGHRLIVCDFSAIEARVIAWYADEKETLEIFRTSGKIYESTASRMFKIPMDKIDKATRQKGKIATLALGYQGSVGAMKAMGALKMGMKEEELPEIVDKWREANFKIVKFWRDCETAVKTVLTRGGVVHLQKGLRFYKSKGFLFIKLPSGRSLAYAKPRLEPDQFGSSKIVYDGQGDKVGFTKLDTYGGKLVENIVQATARDLLADAMLRVEEAGYPIVFHIHDEIVTDVPNGFGSLEEMRDIMCQPVDWAEGLPLNAAGFESPYYKKD